MRVLYYNWVDPLDRENRGGGVSLYLHNLIKAIEARDAQEELEVTCLSSGLAHRLRQRGPGWAPVEPGSDQGRLRRFELVDSGVLSPAHADYGNPTQVSHPPTEAAFADFLQRTGPYDVIHFHNLEGVPAAVLEIAASQPRTRVVLTLHNYYPFCPQVNLWHRESASCTDFDGGRKCVDCVPVLPNRRATRLAMATAWQLSQLGAGPGTRLFDRAIWPTLRGGWHAYKRLRGKQAAPEATPATPAPVAAARAEADIANTAIADPAGRVAKAAGGRRNRKDRPGGERAAADPRARAFAERRENMVSLINRHCDSVLCVSDRVRRIARNYGIKEDRLQTAYIGTVQAGYWQRTTPRGSFLDADGTLHLAYLGYMRADKGFPFLMQALAALPDDMLARLRLTLAARRGAPETVQAMQALKPRVAALHHVDGYGHDQLDALLDGVGLGLVPVMWEDNLPQVAIEMHARHIPLLTSDMGGARELGNFPPLVFRAGDKADFAAALQRVLSGQVSPDAYWRAARPPVDMAAHMETLAQVYGAQKQLLAAQ